MQYGFSNENKKLTKIRGLGDVYTTHKTPIGNCQIKAFISECPFVVRVVEAKQADKLIPLKRFFKGLGTFDVYRDLKSRNEPFLIICQVSQKELLGI